MSFLDKTGVTRLWANILALVKKEVNEAIAAVPTPDVSGQINAHNTSTESHSDIRAQIAGLETGVAYIDSIDVTTVEIPSTLDDYSWEAISAISAAGTGANYFAVGDCKAVALKGTVGTLELDATYYVYILGFNHNSEVEGNGITFGTFKTAASDGIDVCLVDSNYKTYAYSDGTKYFSMNHWGNYYNGGWAGCDMRYDILGSTDNAPSDYGAAKTTSVVGNDPSSTCATSPVANTLMAALPADLRAVMKPMTKYTDGNGNSSNIEANVVVTIDYLPLLAEFEIFGTRKHANIYEQNKQKQYDYYGVGNSAEKYRHSTTDSTAFWWERSANYSSNISCCCVSTVGHPIFTGAGYALGIAPIFKV